MIPPRSNRKLTTILAADVVGYSHMMALDEDATHETLKAYRAITDGLVEKHDGRVFSTAGDAFLAEFGSVVEGVRCAISIQEEIAARNSQLSEERQMWFRIGINVGDVIEENKDLFGDGVNVAARLEGLAEKGGICISGATFEQVKNKLSIAFDDIGEHRVKNIPDPIAAYRLVPGNIAVNDQDATKTDQPSRSLGIANVRPWVLASVFLLVAGAGVLLYFFSKDSSDSGSISAFDGRWKVTLQSLSGCSNNTTRSFPVHVIEGKIDEPDQPRPKTGMISSGGAFLINVTDSRGNVRATLSGTISGKTGDGKLQGKKPECTGNVVMEFLN